MYVVFEDTLFWVSLKRNQTDDRCSNVYLGPSLRDPGPPDEHGVDFFGGSTSGIRQEWQGPAGISSNKHEPGFHCRRLLTSSTSTNEKRGPLAPLKIYRRVGEYGTVSCEDII